MTQPPVGDRAEGATAALNAVRTSVRLEDSKSVNPNDSMLRSNRGWQ